MPFRQHLSHEDITDLHKAAVEAGLTTPANRASLLGGLSAAFVASLPTNASPTAQLLADLHALNTIEVLTDGSVPLHRWLTNARDLAVPRTESAVFQRALDKLAPATAAPGLTTGTSAGHAPAPARKPTGAELKQLAEALLGAFPSRAALTRMLRFELDRKLDEITAESKDLRAAVFDLLTAAEAEGWLLQLVDAAVGQNPGNAALRAVAAKLHA